MTSNVKKLLKILLGIVLAVALFAAGGIGYLSLKEYKPDAIESISTTDLESQSPISRELSLLTWNIGYAGLGEDSDFVLDGGEMALPPSSESVTRNLEGIRDTLLANPTDVVLLQEVDIDSHRTNNRNDLTYLEAETGLQGILAYNYRCEFVPFPWPMLGKMNSGVATLTSNAITDASRISLPNSFSWPVRIANLKRCLLVSEMPIENSDQKLILINLHLEAYDSGEGKIAQTKMLWEILQSEYEKGNYVIAGGDFNQSFPGSLDTYPILDTKTWMPGILETTDLPEGWSYAYDDTSPSCRLLNMPYDPENPNTQYYTIDGFITSPNVSIEAVNTLDESFQYSDHNPVQLQVTLSD